MGLYEIFMGYVIVSLVIGVIRSAKISLQMRANPQKTTTAIQSVNEEMMDMLSRKGHIQKEVYDKRVVHYERTIVGEAGNKSIDALKRLHEKKSIKLAILFFLIGAIGMAVAWPKELFDYLFTSNTDSSHDR